MRKIFRFACMALLPLTGLSLASCTEDYHYSATPAAVGSQVYFSTSLPSQVEISPEATSFDLIVSRIDSADAITVPLTSTVTAGSIFSVPASVSFQAGKRTAAVAVSYNPANIEYGRYDTISVAIADAAYSTPYGNSKTTFTAGVTDWGPWQKWNDAGTATYSYANYYSGDDTGLAFTFRHNTIKENLYQFKLANWGGLGGDLVLDYDKSTGHVTCMPQHAADHASYGEVYVADSYYYWFNIRGTDISKMSEDDYGHFDEENGIITIPMAWYVSAGAFGYNPEIITIDGYTRADLEASVAYAGKFIDSRDNYFVVASVTLGADIESANLALVTGTPTDEDIAAIASGDYEPMQTLTKSGDSHFDASELADGEYTFVLVPFFEGEALPMQTATFTYATAGKETWKQVGTGDYTYTIFFADEDDEGNVVPVVDEGLAVYQSESDPMRYRVAHWGYDVDFVFTWNKDDNSCNVPASFVGYTHPSYGDVYVMEAADYNPEKYGEYASVYDDGESTFRFVVAYVVEAGSFGAGIETLKVAWGDDSRGTKMAPKKSPLVRSLEMSSSQRYESLMRMSKQKRENSVLTLKHRK